MSGLRTLQKTEAQPRKLRNKEWGKEVLPGKYPAQEDQRLNGGPGKVTAKVHAENRPGTSIVHRARVWG